MAVEIREVVSRQDLKTFIYLPEKIHAGHENWVHPLFTDDWKYFDAKKNKAFGYCDTILLVAWKDGRPVGRAMGIINHRYNEHRNEKTARFGYLDTYEDKEVFRALLGFVESWARAKGMTKIVGPYGFSDQDPEGFLIEGFEHRATIATYYNFEWVPRWLEEEGYTKDNDWFVYKLAVPKVMPEFYQRIYDRAMKRGTYKIIDFKTRKEIKPWIRRILGLMNETYMAGNIYGYAPARRAGDGRPGQALPADRRSPLRQGGRQGRRDPVLYHRYARHDRGHLQGQGPPLSLRVHPCPAGGQEDETARPSPRGR